jgi:hypothetical protein
MDLINKQEALRLLKLNYDDSPTDVSDLMYNDGVRSCIKTVREMKVVYARSGRWETYIISMLDGEGCRCSECRFEGVPYWDYCPNCGAMMVGEGDG